MHLDIPIGLYLYVCLTVCLLTGQSVDLCKLVYNTPVCNALHCILYNVMNFYICGYVIIWF